MSPEQASGNGADIDTHSDIYSLGVLLYELLTGVTPLDARKISTHSHVELRRAIREQDPVRPSARIGTLPNTSKTTLSRTFQVEPKGLPRWIRGDLDWITLMALPKDRDRRYATAADLAQDIQRYLRNEPVSAVAPSPSSPASPANSPTSPPTGRPAIGKKPNSSTPLRTGAGESVHDPACHGTVDPGPAAKSPACDWKHGRWPRGIRCAMVEPCPYSAPMPGSRHRVNSRADPTDT